MEFSIIYIFAILVIGATAQCPDFFRRFSNEHTYCKSANPDCKVVRSFVTKDDIALILKQHNDFRSKIATGKQSGIPSAANMLEMVWDDELAAVAQKHAALCKADHDCNDCRRVPNFSVGQNLASRTISNSGSPPQAQWADMINMWYNEVKFFDKSYINPYVPHQGPKKTAYGHFTQVVWAGSWRIGCGYVLHKIGNEYEELYTCNYGPAGNTKRGTMYKEGKSCSSCPENSCCGNSCGGKIYPGLCRITDNKAPVYKPTEKYLFYCDFHDQKDCGMSVDGVNKWFIYPTLSGNYMGIVLNGGEKSTITFANNVKPSAAPFCVAILYRKGPNIAGQKDDGKATATFTIAESGFSHSQPLRTWKIAKFNFNPFSMQLGWDDATKIKISLSVPSGSPAQFFEVQKVFAKAGSKC